VIYSLLHVFQSFFLIDYRKNLFTFYFLASSAKMGLVETKLAIIPGAGMNVLLLLPWIPK